MSTTPIAADAPADLDRLYTYAAYMLGDRAAALAAVRSVVAGTSPGPLPTRLQAVRTTILAHATRRRHSPVDVHARLDDTLRLGTSLSMKMGPTALRSGVRRLPVLLTGFMQTCLIEAVQALPPVQREAFVLLVVLGLPEAEVIALQGETAHGFSSVKAKMFRSMDGYLGPRCGHMHPNNPCKCPNRLQGALDQNFVQLPEHEVPGEAYPTGVYPDVRQLYGAVPPLRLAAFK
jgi:hypothetical protein